MIKFDILNKFTGKVQFTAEIECGEDAERAWRLRLAVLWAIKNKADMSGADMRGADMSGADMRWADMSGADMSGANMREADMRWADMSGANMSGAEGISQTIIDGGIRSDGYRFMLTRNNPGEWRVLAGCRDFTLSDAKKHWDETRPKGAPLGDETRLIIKHMVKVAKLRGWPKD